MSLYLIMFLILYLFKFQKCEFHTASMFLLNYSSWAYIRITFYAYRFKNKLIRLSGIHNDRQIGSFWFICRHGRCWRFQLLVLYLLHYKLHLISKAIFLCLLIFLLYLAHLFPLRDNYSVRNALTKDFNKFW